MNRGHGFELTDHVNVGGFVAVMVILDICRFECAQLAALIEDFSASQQINCESDNDADPAMLSDVREWHPTAVAEAHHAGP